MVARAIVNFGVYQFDDETRSQRIVRLTSQVERQPDNKSTNFKLQKPRSFFGWAQLMIEDWVAKTIELQYDFQLLLDWENVHVQQLMSHACTRYSAAVDIADAIATVGGGVIVAPIAEIVVQPMPYDRIVFKLFSTTTLLIEQTTEPFYNLCDVPVTFTVDEPILSEPSNRDVPANDLDTPYDIPDAPYDEPTADDGETYNPQRPPEPVPGGDEDRNYSVTVLFTRQSYNSVTTACTVGDTEGVTQTVRGPIYGLLIRTEPTFKRLVVSASTGAGNPTPLDYSVATGAVSAPDSCNGFPSYEFATITPL